MSNLFSIDYWKSLTEEISTVHDEPVVLPDEYIKGKFLPAVATIATVLTIIYLVAFNFVDKIIPKDSPAVKKSIICYQITNILFNIFTSSLGFYYEYWILPKDASVLQSIIGLENEVYMMSALQLGYQVWAMPVGFLFVNETAEMMLHHSAVVVNSVMSGFLTVGYRYYTPYYYGIMEFSSVPLSIMNTFKHNPEWIEKYPKRYELSRVVFALSFLFVRVYMCIYRWPFFLTLNVLVAYTKEMGVLKSFMTVQCATAFFLAYLQLFWGHLVLKGLIKAVFFPPKDEDSDKKESKKDK